MKSPRLRCVIRRFDSFFADRLATLCKEANFDGYLVNIETPSVPTPLLQPLQEFLKRLRSQLRAISPTCQLIWYDSIDVRGALNYQNQLNAQNRPFFNACDGIFLNYWWQPQDLIATRQIAGNRSDFGHTLTRSKRDVYVGIDVWGRGTHCGGGYNTYSDLELIAKQGLSCALFAPGWVFEHEFDCRYSSEYVKKEADFWHNTLLSVTESGSMCLTQSPTCVTFYARSVVLDNQ